MPLTSLNGPPRLFLPVCLTPRWCATYLWAHLLLGHLLTRAPTRRGSQISADSASVFLICYSLVRFPDIVSKRICKNDDFFSPLTWFGWNHSPAVLLKALGFMGKTFLSLQHTGTNSKYSLHNITKCTECALLWALGRPLQPEMENKWCRYCRCPSHSGRGLSVLPLLPQWLQGIPQKYPLHRALATN